MATVPSAAAQFAGQQTSPLESIARLVQLKNALAQQQLIPGALQAQQQGLQSGALDLQQKQMQLASQQAQMRALQKNFNYGTDAPDNGNQSAVEPGASPNAPTDTTTQGEIGTPGGQTSGKSPAYTPKPTPGSVLSTASPSPAASDFTNKMWNVYGDMMHSGQVLPNDLFNFAGGILKQQKDFADLSKTQQDINLNQLKNAKDLASQGLAITNPAEQAQFWQDTQERLRNDPEAASLYSPSLVQHVLNTPYPGEEALGHYFTAIRGSEAALADEKARYDNLEKQQKVGPLPLATAAATQAEIDARLHVLNPKGNLNASFRLPPNATQADIDRIDVQLKALEGSSPELAGRKAGAEAAARVGPEIAAAVGSEVGKQRALAIPLHQVQRTTISGQPYIDESDLPPQSAAVMRQQAAAAGLPVVSKDTADVLREVDTAKANQGYMLTVLGNKLATNPGSRLWTAPENTIEKLAQTDPDLAAVGTFRNAAVQSMRAVAGSKGLRMNQALVEQAIENDIPKMTDTLPTAQAKLKNLNAFLDNSVNAHLNQNRTGMVNAAQAAATKGASPAVAPPPAGATMKVPGSDGKLHWSDGTKDLGIAQQ
ncbi:MAG: hypothetical protein WAK20_02650 [Candidatus Acidiferrum sp.]